MGIAEVARFNEIQIARDHLMNCPQQADGVSEHKQ